MVSPFCSIGYVLSSVAYVSGALVRILVPSTRFLSFSILVILNKARI